MQKDDMQKPETNNQTFPPRVPPMEKQQEKYNIRGNIKTMLGKVEKVMRFLKDIKIYEHNK